VDVTQLSRLQFALTISFHFIFPSITIGLAGLIAIIETFRWRTRRDVYDRLSVFLTKLFAVTFVIGVVSGIVMEFQFGTNWSRFSGFVGDIFGAPLAAEGILAFFLESAFVGLILFGRQRVSSTVRWIAGVLVFLGTTLSAFWILVANSWMQTPAGYVCQPDPSCSQSVPGEKAVLTDFWAAIFNPSILPRFMHTVSACWVVGAFFVMGISAWYVLRGRNLDIARIALPLAVVIAFAGSGLMFVTGDLQTREVYQWQPIKFAAMEGLFQTENGAPLDLIALPPAQSGPLNLAIGIPNALSLMTTGDLNGQIKGLANWDQSLWPPVAMTFVGFHTMVGIGALMLLLMLLGIFFLWRKTIEKHTIWLKLAVAAIPLPILAVEFGWMTAEVGRQPWIVYNLMRTVDGTSPGVSAGDVAVSIAAIVVLYAFLLFLWLYAIRKEIATGPEPAPALAMSAEDAAAAAEPTATPTIADVSADTPAAPATTDAKRARKTDPNDGGQ
jgi:cytochrome d ubiquinol oxidase subunit I